MAHYSFSTIWKFNAPVEDVWREINDTHSWTAWWRGVKAVIHLKEGNELGVGGAKRFIWKSFLPYHLTFDSEVTFVDPFNKITGLAFGDLDGEGTWTFYYQHEITTVRYDWKVRTTKKWMNLLEPIARPVFEWNHDVVMRWGGEGLARKLGCNLM